MSRVNERGRKMIQVSAAVAGGLALASVAQANFISWGNTSNSSPPTAAQNWNIGSNWGGGNVPLATDTGGIGNGGVALVNDSETITAFVVGNSAAGGGLYIANGGSLTITDSNNPFRLINNGPVSGTVEAGGTLSATSGTVGIGTNSTGAPATFTSAGTVSASYVTVANSGVYNMTGGSLTVSRTYGSLLLGGSGAGTFNQSGGTNTNGSGQLELSPGGTYQIGGGSISMGSTTGLYFYGASSGSLGGTIQVIGSGATGITFGGVRYYNSYDQSNSKWSFVLDNSTAHITKIGFSANGSSGAVLRTSSTLSVGLNGGVLLSGTNAYTLIQRPTGATDTAWGTGPDGLWTDTTNTNGTSKQSITVALAAAADQGTLDATGNTALSFSPTAYGYVNLSHINLSNPLSLYLDVTGGTLSHFTDALTAAGITWASVSGPYDVALTLNPSVSGGNYFAWDLSGIDPAMQVQGASLSIPEPASLILLVAGGLLMLPPRKRRA